MVKSFARFVAMLLLVVMGQFIFAQTIPGKFSSIPQYMRLAETEQVSAGEFASWMNQRFLFPSGNGFKLLSTETDRLGMVHYRYRQTVNGIPVEGTMYIAHAKNGIIQSISGDLLERVNAPLSAAVSKAQAIQAALNYVNAISYKWQSPQAEEALKENTGNPAATYYPNPEMVYLAEKNKLNSGKFYLAYKMDVYALEPLSRHFVYVDAVTGAVVHAQNRIEHADAPATANTQYSGVRTITTDTYNNTYRLREAARGNGIRTYNALTSTNPANTDFTNATTTWNNINTSKDQYATDAHFASEMTYDFYKNNFNRNSLDGNGLTLASYVHYDQDLDNAFWDGGAMYYGDGNATNGTTPYTTLDIGGHEITHGLTQFTADLNYQDESGALNESFSDCMGVAIRQFVKQLPSGQVTQIYSIGNDNGNTFRSLRTPKTYGQPDTYQGQYWYTGTADDGGVHTNSGVHNHWFYIVAQGENGTNDNGAAYNVTGITIEKAQEIAYRSLTVYLTPSSEYADARTYSVLAAQDLYGACSPEVVTTTNAWYAVGVGGMFTPTVVSDFKVPVTNACAAPATISFTATSTNAMYYVWNFGDGSASNQQNPIHTYTTYGDFTVKLMSWSPDCGADSITKTQLIHIADNRPVATDVTICEGSTTTLTATGTGNIHWYDASNGGNLLYNGTPFNTPAITQNITYYAESSIPGPVGFAGPATTTFAAGSYNTSAHYMVFNNAKPQKLVSVLVDANAAGNRTIELRSSNGTVLKTTTVNLVAGIQTVLLNFSLPVQNGLRLGIFTGTKGLYRNSTGASYPYYSTDSSVVITSNDVGDLERYYFFYNWLLEGDPCVSERIPVAVNILTTGCTSAINETEMVSNILLQPNPSISTLNVRINTIQANAEAKIFIRNILGETVLTQNRYLGTGDNLLSFNVSSFAEGVYLFTLESGKQTITKKFVKSN